MGYIPAELKIPHVMFETTLNICNCGKKGRDTNKESNRLPQVPFVIMEQKGKQEWAKGRHVLDYAWN